MTLRLIAVVAAVMFALGADAIDASNRYRSPRNPERKIRASTELIILHTTEAPAKSSLDKLSDRGECHFCVVEDGTVYRIVDRDKVAFHAGRSMWGGKEDVDEFSIGIECVGYHNKEMGIVQLRAVRELVKELKSMYRLSDDKVICHSHVAYGAPNKWHRYKHRGRKRCGMLFAMPSVRKVLQLKRRPLRDEDVRAGRLRNADEYLRKVLYGNVDTMKTKYASVGNTHSGSSSSGIFSWLGFSKKSEASDAVSVKPPKKNDRSVTPKPAATSRSRPTVSNVPPKDRTELLARGYVARGQVNKSQTASKIVGAKWNAHDTYYTIRDKVIPGDQINPAKIEVGMVIWTKK